MAASSKLRREKIYSEATLLRQKNMTHLEEHLKTKRCRAASTRRRKVRREFKLRYPEKGWERKRTSKPNKDITTCVKNNRDSRYTYQQNMITKKVPGQRFVYKLNKHPGNTESEMSSSYQSILPPPDSHAGFSHCPRCLCPRFLSATTLGGGHGGILVNASPSQKAADLPLYSPMFPSATSIPVSVIQRISF